MTRPTRAYLSAAALRHNFERVRHYAPESHVMAIIKANAYGHGLAWAAKHLHDADAFGVASVEEGVALRTAGVRQAICLLEGFFDADELALIGKHQLAPVLHHESQLWDLENTPVQPLDIWLKIDTGMHRLGFRPEATPDVVERLRKSGKLASLRLMSHLANADNTFDATTTVQLERFLSVAEAVGGERSLANSAGLIGWPPTRLDWVRPGIMLYGGSPMMGQGASTFGLQPVMTLASQLIAVNPCRKGEVIGYGGDWICPEDMPIGVVAIGYGDGYPRHAPSGTPVLVNGKRVPLVGRVSMDMITVDLRTQPDARVGDVAILWGRGLPVEEIANAAGTIGYELLCHVTPRVPRVDGAPLE